jgi:PTS system galactitol-specific IIA component
MESETSEEILCALGAALVASGACRESYPEALSRREEESPTGLDMDGFGIALPHTDPSHVISPALAIGVPLRPARFTAMGMDDEQVEARVVCALALNDPAAHLDFVEALLEIFRDRGVLESLAGASSAEEVIAVIRDREAAGLETARASAPDGGGKES